MLVVVLVGVGVRIVVVGRDVRPLIIWGLLLLPMLWLLWPLVLLIYHSWWVYGSLWWRAAWSRRLRGVYVVVLRLLRSRLL